MLLLKEIWKMLREILKAGSFKLFIRCWWKKREFMARIHGIHRCLQNGNNIVGIRMLEYKLQNEQRDILKRGELMWFQRSRAYGW